MSAVPPATSRRDRLLLVLERYALVIAFVAVMVFFSVWGETSSTFPTAANIRNVLGNQAVVGVLALGVMFPLVASEFDFSVGPIAGLTQVLTAGFMARLGMPLLVILFDATDNLDKYLAKKLPPGNIVMSYVYGLPDSIFLILPAAVLFATVFSIGAFTRHSEITAGKASGVSFYRFIAPIFLGAVIASAKAHLLRLVSPALRAISLMVVSAYPFATNSAVASRIMSCRGEPVGAPLSRGRPAADGAASFVISYPCSHFFLNLPKSLSVNDLRA